MIVFLIDFNEKNADVDIIRLIQLIQTENLNRNVLCFSKLYECDILSLIFLHLKRHSYWY